MVVCSTNFRSRSRNVATPNGDDQWKSFQYSRFMSHANQVNTSRNSTTRHAERAPRRLGGLAHVVEEVDRSRTKPWYSAGLEATRSQRLEV